MDNYTTTIIGSAVVLLSVLIGHWITNRSTNKRDEKAIKLDCVRRIVGNMQALTSRRFGNLPEPRIEIERALNEALVVFNSNAEIVTTILNLFEDDDDFDIEARLSILIKLLYGEIGLRLYVEPEVIVKNLASLGPPPAGPMTKMPLI
ncbi:MAG: hypothetical protein OXL40_10155 [Bacteroidota bacterium]|nr:hypothetical protein [Bacteroidota bacterium]